MQLFGIITGMKNLTLKEKIKACWYILTNKTDVAQTMVRNNAYIQGYNDGVQGKEPVILNTIK